MKLYSQRFEAHHAQAPHYVLLHGFGASSRIWQPCLSLLRQQAHLTLIDLPGYGQSPECDSNINDLLDAMVIHIPTGAVVVGFSLGGMFAIQLAARHPKHVSAVVTVGANQQFVATAAWPWAMAENAFQDFSQTVLQTPSMALKRFMGLQAKGADNERALLKTLKSLLECEEISQKALLTSLNQLATINNTSIVLPVPLLMLFGERDQLVPKEVAAQLARKGFTTELINGAAHLPFISHSEQFCQMLKAFSKECDLG